MLQMLLRYHLGLTSVISVWISKQCMVRMQQNSIISFNVNGLNNRVKREKILLQLEKDNGDIICLQETHLQKQEHKNLKIKTKSQVYFSSYNSSQKGVAVIIKPHVGFEMGNCVVDKEGRCVLVVGKIKGTEFSFFNVYYPPDTGTEFMLHLIELVTTKSKGILIILIIEILILF